MFRQPGQKLTHTHHIIVVQAIMAWEGQRSADGHQLMATVVAFMPPILASVRQADGGNMKY